MEEQLESLGIGEPLSGQEITEDLAACLVEGLSGNCYLRGSDSYSSYAAKIRVELQLHDIDTVAVEKTLLVGDHDPSRPSRPFEIEVQQASAQGVRERSGLTPPSMEVGVDGSPITEMPAKRKVRFYAPRKKGVNRQ